MPFAAGLAIPSSLGNSQDFAANQAAEATGMAVAPHLPMATTKKPAKTMESFVSVFRFEELHTS